MNTPVLSTGRFDVGFSEREVGITYRRSNGTTLIMFFDPEEADAMSRALKIAANKLTKVQPR